MAKHTPGPWHAGLRTVTAPETEDRLPLDVRLYGGNHDDHRANVRVIAAAPDMLEALHAADEALGLLLHDAPTGEFSLMRVAWDAVRAAIAKATGSAS